MIMKIMRKTAFLPTYVKYGNLYVRAVARSSDAFQGTGRELGVPKPEINFNAQSRVYSTIACVYTPQVGERNIYLFTFAYEYPL